MPPLIGITCAYDDAESRYYLRRYYSDAILRCKGIAIILPAIQQEALTKKISGFLQGLLLSGGGDVDPVHFGEEPRTGSGTLEPDRDLWEIALVREMLRVKKPVLAICRGVQILNIAAGGNIYQDLQEEVREPLKHLQEAPRWYPTHRVDIEPDSMLAQIFSQRTIRVNSFHHQAVKKVAPGLNATAVARDGVIEALESCDGGFVLGVQWHPECMWEKDTSQLEIFRSFVRAAKLKSG